MRLKRSIVTDLSKIDITKKHHKKTTDDCISFDEEETDLQPYLGVLIVLMPVAGVTIPRVLVDTGSALNILFTNTLKWMGILANFL